MLFAANRLAIQPRCAPALRARCPVAACAAGTRRTAQIHVAPQSRALLFGVMYRPGGQPGLRFSFQTFDAGCVVTVFQPITRRRFAAIAAVLGQLTTQIKNLLRLGCYHFVKLSDPAQSRVEEVFKSSRLVHSNTDSEKSSQRHEIQTTTKNSCAQWPRRLTSKLTKTRYRLGCLGVTKKQDVSQFHVNNDERPFSDK